METVLTIAWPLFGIILAGYSARRLDLLDQAGAVGVHAFVYYFALPALLFVKVAEMPLSHWLNWPLMGAYYSAGSLVLILALVLGRLCFHHRLAVLGLQGVAAIYPNVGYMGLPLVLMMFGEAGTAPAVLFFVCDNLLGVLLPTILIEADLEPQHQWRQAVYKVGRGLVCNPMIGAVFVGALVAGMELTIPVPMKTIGEFLSAAATPGALFALGASLAVVGQPSAERMGEVALPVGLKLIVHPLLVWFMVTYVVTVEPLWRTVAIVEAILPTGMGVFVMAQRYKIAVDLTSTTVLVATAASIVTVSVVIGVMTP